MAPAIAELELELEKLIARADLARDLRLLVVLPAQLGLEVLSWKADPAAVGELELMQMPRGGSRRSRSGSGVRPRIGLRRTPLR
jgi:hypothetical protein